MENQVIKDQTLQGCHYVIIGFRALKLLSGHIESLYFVAINARDVGKITQRTLMFISGGTFIDSPKLSMEYVYSGV